MKKIFKNIINQTKEFASDVAKDISNDIKISAKDKLKDLIISQTDNLIDRGVEIISNKLNSNNINYESVNQSNDVGTEANVFNKETALVKCNEDSKFICDNELILINNNSFNEKIYIELIESKLKDGKISEASKYFLKLNRKKLNISDERAKELENTLIK